MSMLPFNKNPYNNIIRIITLNTHYINFTFITLITLITIIHIIHVILLFPDFPVHCVSSSNSCSRLWRSTWSWWRSSAIWVSNTSNTSCPCRVIRLTSSLYPSYASACNGSAPSGIYSRDCTWHGRIENYAQGSAEGWDCRRWRVSDGTS